MFKSLVNQKISVKQKEAESLWADQDCNAVQNTGPAEAMMLGSSLLSTIQTGSS